MTPWDEALFTEALKDVFPSIVFATIGDYRPRLTYVPSIDASDDRSVRVWLSTPGWVEKWELKNPRFPEFGYRISNLPARNFEFLRDNAVVSNKTYEGMRVETFCSGRILACYDTGDREVRAFIDKVYRLSGKFVTNKFALIDPDAGTILENRSHWLFWAGHDALASCRRHRNRYIELGSWDDAGRRYFLGPRADWQPPDDAWHRTLRARVEARGGPETGAAKGTRAASDRP